MRGRTILAVLGALALALATVAGAGTAAAQNATESAADRSANATETAEQLGDLRIHSYEYSGGEFVIEATWQGSEPETVTLTEMVELDSAGSTEISFQRVRMLPNQRTEITIPAEERHGGTAAVMVTTDQSTEDGKAVVLQSGEPTSYDDVPFWTAVLLVGVASVGTGAAAFLYVRKRLQKTERSRERIA